MTRRHARKLGTSHTPTDNRARCDARLLYLPRYPVAHTNGRLMDEMQACKNNILLEIKVLTEIGCKSVMHIAPLRVCGYALALVVCIA